MSARGGLIFITEHYKVFDKNQNPPKESPLAEGNPFISSFEA